MITILLPHISLLQGEPSAGGTTHSGPQLRRYVLRGVSGALRRRVQVFWPGDDLLQRQRFPHGPGTGEGRGAQGRARGGQRALDSRSVGWSDRCAHVRA